MNQKHLDNRGQDALHEEEYLNGWRSKQQCNIARGGAAGLKVREKGLGRRRERLGPRAALQSPFTPRRPGGRVAVTTRESVRLIKLVPPLNGAPGD
ncbi:unnamed protein product [Boreogadus saida]